MRRLRYVPVVLGVVVLAAAGARAAFSSHSALSSTKPAFVHEDASIGRTFDDGSNVGSQAANPPSIPAGTYTILAVDDAFTHNFHLAGPGVEVGTTIGGMGTPSWTVTFQAGGRYRFQCDDHPDFMYGEFIAGAAGSGGQWTFYTSAGAKSVSTFTVTA